MLPVVFTQRFRPMDNLSGGEKTVAALALLFSIHRCVVVFQCNGRIMRISWLFTSAAVLGPTLSCFSLVPSSTARSTALFEILACVRFVSLSLKIIECLLMLFFISRVFVFSLIKAAWICVRLGAKDSICQQKDVM